MDFHSLARKDLQTLCKKNKIPANKTNVAMADALQALQHVEGLEEFLNPSEFQNPQATEILEIGSPEIPKTATTTSTRRKLIKAVEDPESSQTLTQTRRGTRRITEELSQESSQPPQTPLVPSSRKRAPAASARQRTSKEQSSVQHSYGTRRSARLSERMGRKEPMHIESSRALCKDLDLHEEENKGHDLVTISEEISMITNDSEVFSDKKSDQSESDSKSEVEEITEVSSRPDVKDSIKVLEATVEPHGDEENKEVQQKNRVDCEKRAESKAGKGTDISSVTMLITKNSNEAVILEGEHHQHMESDMLQDGNTLPQASDDSNCESEKPELRLTVSGDGVVCKNPVVMESEKNATIEGAEPNNYEEGKAADQGGSEEFGMDFNQKTTADTFSSGLDTDHSVPVDQSEAEVKLESAKQRSMAFEDDASLSSNYNQGDGKEFDDNLNQTATDAFSIELGSGFSVVAQSVATHANQGSMDFEDDASPPSSYNKGDVEEFDKNLNKKTTEILEGTDFLEQHIELEFSKQGNTDFEDDALLPSDYVQGESEFEADQSEAHAELEFSKHGCMDFEEDAEKFNVDLFQKTTDCSIVVDQSEAQVELEFAKDGSIDFGDIASSLSISNSKPETEERNVNKINMIEPLPKGEKISFVSAAEEHGTADKFPPSSVNFPSPVKIMSPRFWVANDMVSGKTTLSPLATSRSTPRRKSSSNRPSTLFSDNKENLDSGKKIIPKTEMVKKKVHRDTAEDIMLKKLNDTSLRQLRKMFKEKLQIKENAHNEDVNVVKEVVKMRPALQTLAENRTADDGTGKDY